MGLHRRETILKTFLDENDRMIALRVLWSVYTLERRTSLSQGVPYSIQDSHIDPSLFTMVSLDTVRKHFHQCKIEQGLCYYNRTYRTRFFQTW